MLWRPRSLLQLMLVGFFTVVAPLCVAIFYTVQAFDSLSINNNRMTRDLVVLTRTNQVLQSDLLDLERRAGQYVALGEENLLALFEQGYQRIRSQFDEIEVLIDEERNFHLLSLRESLERLHIAMLARNDLFDGEAVLAMFDGISRLSVEFRRASSTYVDEQLALQVYEAGEIKRSLLLMVSLLALVTLFAVLFFTYWINRPVRQLEREIGQLGSGDLTRRIRISGPQEMQLLGERLDWLRAQLHELDEQKQEFLRHMSHELKTPLASMREGADLMAEGVVGSLDQRQLEIVSIIQQNSLELQRLIENLLDYNLVLQHRQLNTERVDIQALWTELLKTYAMTVERKNIRISCEGESLCWIADASKLRTVLDNLLSNAISYSPSDGEVAISWNNVDNTLVCEVSNSGQQIASDEAEQIFRPFYQGRNSRSGAIKGSGIGLSVARECTHAHGGTLELMPEGRLPVCFSLKLPLLEVNP